MHELSVCFEGIESKAIIRGPGDTLAVSSGSACTTMSPEQPHALPAPGTRIPGALAGGVPSGTVQHGSDINTAIVPVENQIAKLASL